jgi:hypothetical protein
MSIAKRRTYGKKLQSNYKRGYDFINVVSNVEDVYNPEKLKEVSIELILNGLSSYDFDPPYQRDSVWKEERRVKFIESIIKGLPVGPISLVRKGNEGQYDYSKYWVLDGKQRLESIIKFVQNEYPVGIVVEGKNEIILYEDIVKRAKNGSGSCNTFLTKLQQYTFSIASYRYMDFESQRKLFYVINYAEPLTKDERLFCATYILCRNLLSFLWTDVIVKNIGGFINKKDILLNEREKSTKLLSKILRSSFGVSLDSNWQAIGLRKKTLEPFMEWTEGRLSKAGWSYSGRISAEEVRALFPEMHNTLEAACKTMKAVLEYKPIIMKGSMSYNTVVDYLIFFIRHYQDKTLTPNFVKENTDKFVSIYELYLIFKEHWESSASLKQNSNSGDYIKIKQERLDEILSAPLLFRNNLLENLDKEVKDKRRRALIRDTLNNQQKWDFQLDLGKKDKPLTKAQKSAAYINCDGFDPVSGAQLLPGDTNVHHVDSNSCNSDTDAIVVTTQTVNLKAGGNSRDYNARQKSIFDDIASKQHSAA